MSQQQPVICLEFSELTPVLLDRFLQAGHLPNFQRLRDESIVQTTDANAEGEWLNPWVQWVTVHSGLEAAEHEVYRLSNAYKLTSPSIWDVVSAAGENVWVCGSMNPWCSEDLNGHILPDPWSYQVNPYPKGEFDDYDGFVRKNVQEYAAKKTPVSIRERWKFLSFMLDHGLHVSTIRRILGQLVKEKFGRHRWKRAAVLDAIQYDLFEWYYKKHQPTFSTFFSNSTAHFQHKFWRNMEPESFLIRPSSSEQRAYRNAILYGYRQMDQLVGRVLNLAPKATIVLISALGQQAFQEKDNEGGIRHYRLHNKEALTNSLKITGEFNYEPIMADEFFLKFANEIDAEACSARLLSLQLPDGTPAFSAELEGCEVIGQCRCRQLMPDNAQLTVAVSGEQIDFHDVFYWVDSIKSGTHHPDGIFWIRQPGHACEVRDEKVSLTTIAPSILELLDIEKPESMHDQSVLQSTGAAGSSSRLRELVQA
ncbi:hypothetical protein [Thalassoglobus polymorphus]|uniref:Type I phosphodiesterase / nucleotide pyrophosphatase n=1 Tax=Thalassoglobus polymorphus TaxID=2527994 RepID=A0A517QV80_9PLAN|nr:hypothetical protein [Thalassoglobus polymorphus]QDT35497.1 Type I phosphodiesterase / nucleotide pyrophosphatase [Thalassoglobus polymorphus]